jgi:hypothetical protein
MLSPQSFEVAQALVHERLAQAASAAVAAQVAPQPTLLPVVAARHYLAGRLRALALRLDPSACCEPCLLATDWT